MRFDFYIRKPSGVELIAAVENVAPRLFVGTLIQVWATLHNVLDSATREGNGVMEFIVTEEGRERTRQLAAELCGEGAA